MGKPFKFFTSQQLPYKNKEVDSMISKVSLNSKNLGIRQKTFKSYNKAQETKHWIFLQKSIQLLLAKSFPTNNVKYIFPTLSHCGHCCTYYSFCIYSIAALKTWSVFEIFVNVVQNFLEKRGSTLYLFAQSYGTQHIVCSWLFSNNHFTNDTKIITTKINWSCICRLWYPI